MISFEWTSSNTSSTPGNEYVMAQSVFPMEIDSNVLSTIANAVATQDENKDSEEEIYAVSDLSAKYLIKIQEDNKLTDKATQKIVTATWQLFNSTIQTLKRKVHTCLAMENINWEHADGLNKAFDDAACPFGNLTSTWAQKSYYKTCNKYVAGFQWLCFYF